MNRRQYNTPVAEALANIIAERGLKKSAVAKRMNITPQQLTDMIKGRRIIKACDIPKIVMALGVEPNDLYKSTSNSPPTAPQHHTA